jgi:hypothetical protein
LIPDGEDGLKIEHMKANLGARSGPVRLKWHEGVPLVSGSYTNYSGNAQDAIVRQAQKEQDEAHKAALVALVQDFDRRGETVTTSFNGPVTVFKLLKSSPGYPKGLGSDQLARLLREMESEQRIYRRMRKTPDRKLKQVFTCKRDEGESAPNATGEPVQAGGEPLGGALNG